jgi:hypothetical protein
VTTPPGCPSCGAPLSGAAACPSCELPLSGPLAYRLWQVDQQLLAISRQAESLEAERESLLTRLRAGETVAPPVLAPAQAWPGAAPAAAPPPWPAAGTVARPKESSPAQVQNTLLTLGALLLAGAGIVFTAVTYQHLGVVGRALVLLTLTAAALWAPTRLLPRGLTASAESIAAVGVVLALLDVYALRRAGIGQEIEASSYSAVALAALSALLASYSALVPVRVTRWSATVLSQLPLPLVLGRLEVSPATAGAWLAVQAGIDLAVVAKVRLAKDVRALLGALGGAVVVIALMVDGQGVADHERATWVGFALLAAGTGVGAWGLPNQVARDLSGAAVVPLLTAAAWAGARPELTDTQEPLVLTAVAVLGLQAIGLLPRDRRLGPAAGALAVSVVSLLVEAEAVLQAFMGPLTWLADPWTRTATGAREALALDRSFTWDGTVVTLVVLAGAALAVVTAGFVLDRVVPSLVPAGVLLVLSGVTLPLGLATSYRDALLLLLLVGGALTAVGLAALERLRVVAIALVASGVTTMLLAASWSLADRDATLVVLPVVAVLCAGLSLALPGVLAAVALLLGAGELAAVGVDQGLATDQVGGLLLAAVAVCGALSLVLPGLHRLAAEVSCGAVAIAALGCAAYAPGWLSWVLAGSGLVALAISVKKDRRAVGLVGGLLLSASSWVRLADAGVTAPEPYVAPLAAAALVAGVLRRRSHPTAGSWECFGAALTVGLVPSLLKSFGDEDPTRGLLLLVVCVAIVLVGGATKQQAPLALGAVVGALDALWLIAPYANELPRWVLLAGLGLLLVVVGATYEARLRDVRALRERFDELS